MSSPTLSPEQAHALFDILTHHETYSEIEGFKWPAAILKYGPPFSKEEIKDSSSPLLKELFSSFVLKLPGLTTLPQQFWENIVGNLIFNLGDAALSESYDKGAMGTRKTLSTASSVLIENVARGLYGGCPKTPAEITDQHDRSKAEDLKRAWETAAQQLVYGDLIDELYDNFAKSDKLENLSPLVQAAIEHMLLMYVQKWYSRDPR